MNDTNAARFLSNNCSVRATQCVASAFGIDFNDMFYNGLTRIWQGGGFLQTPNHLSQVLQELGEEGTLKTSISLSGDRSTFMRDLTKIVYDASKGQ